MVLVAKLTWVSGLRNQRGSSGCKIGVDWHGWFWPWVIGVAGFQHCGDKGGFRMVGLWFF